MPNFLTAFSGVEVERQKFSSPEKKQSKSWAPGAIVEHNFQEIDRRIAKYMSGIQVIMDY